MKRYQYAFLVTMIAMLAFSCTKFLDEKQDKKLVVPTTLKDLQAILDYYFRVNQFSPGMGDPSSDDYFLPTTSWTSMTEPERRLYTWEKDNVNVPFGNDWSYAYDNVYRANTVLSLLPSIERTDNNAQDWDNVKGQALAIRARSFLALAFSYCLAYDQSTAEKDLGLALRLDPDFNIPSVRASVEATYQQVRSDLLQTAPLLPVIPLHVKRMSKPAAFGLLARTYLSMRQYDKAGMYADSCLQLYGTLMDYNTLNATAKFPFARFNSEVIWECTNLLHEQMYTSNARMDTALMKSYADNDLRKSLFFKAETGGYYSFRGSYDGSENLYDGITTDEIYLTRAEAYARAGNKDAALVDLNKLLLNRWKKGTFVPLTAVDAQAALALIITERRKELVFRGLRWMDLKRYNKENAGITLKRILNAQIFTLPPNDLRYALPIPEDVISLSGMTQNPR